MLEATEIDTRISKVLVQALGVDEGDIWPRATLQGDLGAESIDFLDIVFRLEREFMIRIPRGELFAELLFQDMTQIVVDGRVTDLAMAALRLKMPYADWSDLEHDPRLNRVSDLITVKLLSSYVAWKLGGSDECDSEFQAPATLISSGI
jgi:acyl carrier protein